MLVVFECANNHGGDVAHGIRIIDEFAKVMKEFPEFTFAMKFQYRDLPTFIHPDSDPEDKYVRRFRETNLSRDDRRWLKRHAEERGFLTACTPFDEASVWHVVADGYDILKVGSPSIADQQLVREVWVTTSPSQPIIMSVGGATDEQIGFAVNRFNQYRDITLMHCVSEYPTQTETLQFGQIMYLKEKFPNHKVGLSIHEQPTSWDWQDFAVALGAEVIERHVYVGEPPNEYSVDPEEMKSELVLLRRSFKTFGRSDVRVPGPAPVQFQRREIDGKMWWKPGEKDDVLKDIMDLLEKSHVVIPKGSKMYLSHHYGIDKFREFGAAVIECFNMDDYAKKILVVLPGQYHEEHYHQQKHETFHVLYGDLQLSEGCFVYNLSEGTL